MLRCAKPACSVVNRSRRTEADGRRSCASGVRALDLIENRIGRFDCSRAYPLNVEPAQTLQAAKEVAMTFASDINCGKDADDEGS